MKVFSVFIVVCLLSAFRGLSQNLIIHNPRPPIAETPVHALSEWITPIERFFIRSNHPIPEIDESNWKVEFHGLGKKSTMLSLKNLKKMKTEQVIAVLQCSGNGRGRQEPPVAGTQWDLGAVGNASWEGVPFVALLKTFNLPAEVRFAHFEGADDPAHPTTPPFIRSIPLEKLKEPSTLLAWKMNGVAMPRAHGGPLRLILPGWYGHNWIKWVRKVTFSSNPHSGYVMSKSYKMPTTPVKPGEPWDATTGTPITKLLVNAIVHTPFDGAVVNSSKPTRIEGKAFSGEAHIERIEYSLDNGKNWTSQGVELQPQTLEQSGQVQSKKHSKWAWQSFAFTIPPFSQESISISVRATDSAGQKQPLKHTWNPSGYLFNAVQTITIHRGSISSAEALTLVEQKCVSCHSWHMIFRQKLSPAGWEKTLNKMHQFGADINAEEIKLLTEFLAKIPAQYRDNLARTGY